MAKTTSTSHEHLKWMVVLLKYRIQSSC